MPVAAVEAEAHASIFPTQGGPGIESPDLRQSNPGRHRHTCHPYRGGFGSNENVKVLFQNIVIANAHTNAKGSFTSNFAVPATAKIGFQNNGIIASGKTSGVAADLLQCRAERLHSAQYRSQWYADFGSRGLTSRPMGSWKSCGSSTALAAQAWFWRRHRVHWYSQCFRTWNLHHHRHGSSRSYSRTEVLRAGDRRNNRRQQSGGV